MQRQRSEYSLTTRALLTLGIWLLAVLLLSGCATSVRLMGGDSAAQQMPHQAAAPHLSGTAARKARFFARLKPLIEAENRRIMQQRRQLLQLKQQRQLAGRDIAWLRALAAGYGLQITAEPDYSQWQALLTRIDIVPLEMALAQAANESAWGRSRFARQGNNYFGQWCYRKGCGIVPARRAPGATHEVRCFASAAESVRAYMNNINRSPAYADFRSIRRSLRVQSKPLDAERLAYGLKSYSERGMAYVHVIRSMIRSNRALISRS